MGAVHSEWVDTTHPLDAGARQAAAAAVLGELDR